MLEISSGESAVSFAIKSCFLLVLLGKGCFPEQEDSILPRSHGSRIAATKEEVQE